MRLDSDSDCSKLDHAVFWRILRVLDDDALALVGFGPVLLEEAIADPPVS